MKKNILFFAAVAVIAAIAAVLAVRGCVRGGPQKERVIATINGEPVYVGDFKRSMALNFKRDPMFRVTPQTLEKQINLLIDKRLLIQEARQRKLDQTERFVNTIKTFWEQTLIRDLISHRDREIRDSITVTEKEALDYYDNLSHQKTFQVVKSRDKDLIAKLVKMGPESVNWKETIGPLGYDDISSGLLLKAFAIPEGRVRVIKDAGVYYLFYVEKDTVMPIAPFDEMKDSITEKTIKIKEEKLFRDWLKDVREKADIKINRNVLKEEKYGV